MEASSNVVMQKQAFSPDTSIRHGLHPLRTHISNHTFAFTCKSDGCCSLLSSANNLEYQLLTAVEI
jgi:hypothetical protein